MENQRIYQLAHEFIEGNLKEDDKEEFYSFLNNPGYASQILEVFDSLTANVQMKDIEDPRLLILLDRAVQIDKTDAGERPVRRIPLLRASWLRYAAAIIIVSIGIYWLSTSVKHKDTIDATNYTKIEPGTSKAILTLSNGRQITLNDSSEQIIADGAVSINKTNGVLTYNPALTPETIGYNTMTTPRGGQYQLVLPDGSRVWLNSVSTLKYPVVFNEKIREVELTGEAFFEIKENKLKPFVVKTKKADINVLGTSFNVNAYDDESVLAATLVQGAIKVSDYMQKGKLLKPGEQARISSGEKEIKITRPNLEEVLAWKEGRFQFDGASIQTIMRQISRWYNINVEYRGAIPDAEFNGSLLRSSDPYKLFNAMSLTDKIHFEYEKSRIIVIAGPNPKP